MACNRTWEFPLTRHEKMQRLLILFEDECQRGASELESCDSELAELKEENGKLRNEVHSLKCQLREFQDEPTPLAAQVAPDAAFQSPLKEFPFIEKVAVDTSEAFAFIDQATKKMAGDTEHTVKLVKNFTSTLEGQARAFNVGDVPVHATDALQALHEESAKAIDTAFTGSAKAIGLVRNNCDGAMSAALTEKANFVKLAQAQAQMMQEQAQDFLSVSSWNEPKTFSRDKCPPELERMLRSNGQRSHAQEAIKKNSSLAQERAENVTRKALEAGGSLSTSLWSWGQDIMTSSAVLGVRLPADPLATRQTLDFPLSDVSVRSS